MSQYYYTILDLPNEILYMIFQPLLGSLYIDANKTTNRDIMQRARNTLISLANCHPIMRDTMLAVQYDHKNLSQFRISSMSASNIDADNRAVIQSYVTFFVYCVPMIDVFTCTGYIKE